MVAGDKIMTKKNAEKPMKKQSIVNALAVVMLAGCGGSEPQTSSSTSSSQASSVSSVVSSSSSSVGNYSSSSVSVVLPRSGKEMERLDRGLVAVSSGNGVYLSWRVFGNDDDGVSFNLYRNGQLVNGSPITGASNYTDPAGNTSARYEVKAIVDGVELAAEKTVNVWPQQYLTVNLNRPSGGTSEDGVAYTYAPNDASVADLDGDGEYEIILKWDPTNAKDNSQSGYTGRAYIDAYKLSGQRLWRIDLGRNVRAGAHYVDFMVFDFDGDGKAEMAVKTADGAIDGTGRVIGNANADYRNSDGHVNTGPEFLSVFNGQTGAVMQTIDYPNTRGTISDWGDDYGNRGNRFLAGVAYVDGVHPSMIFARGYYGPQGSRRYQTKITALDWRDGKLTQRWQFHADSAGGNREYLVQGAHSLSVADVDGDGRDEIIYGAATIDDNGQGLYSTGLCHGDALHVADIVPSRPGLEVFMVHEDPGCYGNYGVEVHDARTGQILYSASGEGVDVGRGVVGDIIPSSPGMEVWGSRGGLLKATGQAQSARPGQMNFMAWWDGDLSREILDGTTIDKWNTGSNSTNRLLTAYNFGAASNNGTKSTPALSADMLGDWREEVIWRHENNSQLLIFTTTIPTDVRQYTLMHDPQYRVAIAWQNTGYNQPPHPGFFLGTDMSPAPKPDMHYAGTGGDAQPTTTGLRIQENAAGFCGVDGVVEGSNTGFTGTGYVNTDNQVGASASWAVNVPQTGTYSLVVRYASISERPATLSVNGSAVVNNFAASNTGAWTNWQAISVDVALRQGNNQLQLSAAGADGLANIDFIELANSQATPGTCQ